MDVDLTGSARNIPFVGDMSVINPPRSKETDNFLSVKSDQSPVKAGMDTPSSPYDRQPRRSPRNSTMPPPSKPGGSAKKSWQPAGAKNSSTTPQNGGKFSKRTLKHSVSTSVLPRQSQQGSNNQPVSFRYVQIFLIVKTFLSFEHFSSMSLSYSLSPFTGLQ